MMIFKTKVLEKREKAENQLFKKKTEFKKEKYSAF